jgi:hypothetical protein
MADQLVELPLIGGVYRHYKGGICKVICISRDADKMGLDVVYECLYNNLISKYWHRSIETFMGTLKVDGVLTQRFTNLTKVIKAHEKLQKFVENGNWFVNDLARDNALKSILNLINDTFTSLEPNSGILPYIGPGSLTERCDCIFQRRYKDEDEENIIIMQIVEIVKGVIATTQFI